MSDVDAHHPTDQRDEVVAACRAKIAELKTELDQFSQNLSRKTVLGMTLDGFIGLTAKMSIDVNRVFIDEAPYSPLAKVLPVLCLHRPIAMLGDHRQLPPVCDDEDNPRIRAYWAKPSIFLEDAFRLGANWEKLDELGEPLLERTRRCVLTRSYRFGQQLASLLDRHVYDNIGLLGLGGRNTTINCVHCEPWDEPGRRKRQNHAEADEIVARVRAWWEWMNNKPDQRDSTIAILTPYNNQVSLIREKLRAEFGDSNVLDRVEVWNTHKAQGREWDVVFFSASDTRRLSLNNPWFSDSSNHMGKALLNTTISRTKRHLRIFLDVTDWKQQPINSILAELSRDHTD